MILKKAILTGLFLPFGHILIAHKNGNFIVKNEFGIYNYSKYMMHRIYGIKFNKESIKNLSIK
jgi:hypothetical protein